MLKVALTGGIGAGKSAVCARLAGYGAVVVDSDALARQAVAPGTEGLAAVVEAFGPGVLDAAGALDRAALAARVFADPAARARLEAIVHPRVRALAAAATAAAPPGAVVVADVPLLAETGGAGDYDLVVVVDAAEEVRLARLVGERGMSEADARARMAAQASPADRLALADVVLGNNGPLEDLDGQVAELWAELTSRLA